jgi:integrase
MPRLLSIRQRAIKPVNYIAIQQALAYVTSSESANRKWQLYFRLLWETGMRPGEALNLRAKDIRTGFLIVHRLKKAGHPEDEIRIQPLLEFEIKEYIKIQAIKGRLFPYTIQAVHFIFNKVKKKVLLPASITPHSFRHGFALNVLDQAPPELKKDPVRLLRLLQRSLAHTSIASTSVYINADKEEVDDLMNQMKF